MRKWLVLLVILALMIAATGCLWGRMESGTQQPLMAVWGTNPSDVFAVGGFMSTYITHYDGTDWSPETVPMGSFMLYGVWGSAHNNVFAVGSTIDNKGVILHYDGNTWTNMGGNHPKFFNSVWGTGPNNVFAVGGTGQESIGAIIEHYDGSTWTVMLDITPPPGTQGYGLNAVWGTDRSNVFAVGQGGVILHYNGSAWSLAYSVPSGADLRGVDGHMVSFYPIPTMHVFTVGQGGTIWRTEQTFRDPSGWQYNGVWEQVQSHTTRTLFGVSDVWAVGEAGTIVWYDTDTGEWGPYMTPTREHLFSVWKDRNSDYAYAVGWNGTILTFPYYPATTASQSTEMGLGSSGLVTSNEILSADVVNLGDHVTLSLNVDVASPPLTVEDVLPDALSYIPDTLVVSGGPATCETSEHSVLCVLEGAGSYDITFNVQVTHASGFMGDYLEWYNSGFSTDDLEGEDITVENTVKIGDEVTTETLTIKPFDGFLKLYNNAWYANEEGEETYISDPLTVPTNRDVHWEVCLVACNWSGDDISDMTSIQIKDKLGKGLELNDIGMATYVGGEWSFDYETDTSTLSKGTKQVHLTGKEVPALGDNDVALAGLEISTDKNPGAGKGKGAVGQQEFTDKVLTEHELNSGAELKFIDPETGLQLSVVTLPIVVTADPNWGEE